MRDKLKEILIAVRMTNNQICQLTTINVSLSNEREWTLIYVVLIYILKAKPSILWGPWPVDLVVLL